MQLKENCAVLCFLSVLCVVFVLSCLVLSCLVLSCLVLSCLVLSCLVLSCLVLSCLVLSCLVLSCLVLSCLVLSCLVLSCLVLSCLVLSCLVLSCLSLRLACLFAHKGSKYHVHFCPRPCSSTCRWARLATHLHWRPLFVYPLLLCPLWPCNHRMCVIAKETGLSP